VQAKAWKEYTSPERFEKRLKKLERVTELQFELLGSPVKPVEKMRSCRRCNAPTRNYFNCSECLKNLEAYSDTNDVYMVHL
jgi:hypothetical protein